MSHDHLFSSLYTPLGTYALSPFGNTTAVILTGSPAFHRLGYNLFTGWSGRPCASLPPIHRAVDRLDGVFFCLPAARVQTALALFFNAALVRANLRDVVDEEGDFVEVVCDREAELWEEAQQCACDFVVNHMRSDTRALPTYEGEVYQPVEHGVGHLGAPHVSDDGA